MKKLTVIAIAIMLTGCTYKCPCVVEGISKLNSERYEYQVSTYGLYLLRLESKELYQIGDTLIK